MSDLMRESEEALLARLRAGDESAFAALVDHLHCRLLVLAGTFTSAPGLAEDIVQETWLAVIRGLRGFEGRSSLRTWIFSILVRRARTLAARENRVSVLPAGAASEEGTEEWNPGAGRRGLWQDTPVPWHLEDPAALYQARETLGVVQKAMAELPQRQRQVVLLRDVEDVSPASICNILGISETNQRVLLHRGRARIRAALDRHLRGGDAQAAASPAGSPSASSAAPARQPGNEK